MPTCEKCNKFFKYNYLLTAHYRRKYPCVPFTEKSSFLTGKSSFFTEKSSLLECQYCNQVFDRKYNKEVHENICKKKDDPIWKLESEIGIEHKIPRCDNECEYCRKEMSKANMKRHKETCKERLKYKEILENMKIQKTQGVTNITNITNNNITNKTNNITNNITNNNILNNVNYIMKGDVIGDKMLDFWSDMRRKNNKIAEGENKKGYSGAPLRYYDIARDFILNAYEEILTDERNRNIKYNHERHNWIHRLTEEGEWIKEDVRKGMSIGLKQVVDCVSDLLDEYKEEIKDVDAKIFEKDKMNETNKEIKIIEEANDSLNRLSKNAVSSQKKVHTEKRDQAQHEKMLIEARIDEQVEKSRTGIIKKINGIGNNGWGYSKNNNNIKEQNETKQRNLYLKYS